MTPVPDAVWGYLACGFPVLPKWLSYRVPTGLTQQDRQQVLAVRSPLEVAR